MTINQQPNGDDLLIDLCEFYLLDLMQFIAECMRRTEDDPVQIASDSEYDIPDLITSRIGDMSYWERAVVLAAAADKIKAIAERDREREQERSQKPVTTNDH